MGRNPWVARSDGYPQGAKVWYNNAEYVSAKADPTDPTQPGNTDTPGVGEGATSWIKLNDLSGTSGGSTATCNWDATKIAGIISSLESLTTSMTSITTKIDNLSSTVSNIGAIDVFRLDDTLFHYSMTSEEYGASDGYTLLFPAFLALKGGIFNPSSAAISVEYGGIVYSFPPPTPRIDAGGIFKDCKMYSNDGTGTSYKQRVAVAYDMSSVTLNEKDTYSYTSNTNAYSYGTVLTTDIVSSWLNLNITETVAAIVTIPITLDAGETSSSVIILGGSVGEKATALYNSQIRSARTINVRLLLNTSNQYFTIIISNKSGNTIHKKQFPCTVKTYTIG